MPDHSAHPTRRSLVTGGAGFIGSHLTECLLARGDEVTVIDNLSTGDRDNLPAAAPGLTFVERDLAEAAQEIGPARPLGAFDEIYHLAAAVGVGLVLERPIESIETNIGLTTTIVRAAQHAAPSGGPARLLFASSSEVYGKGVHDVFSENDDVLYGPTTVTRWSYALSKALDEHVVLVAERQLGLPAVVVRFFNTVGPRQTGRYGMVLPRFVRAALAGEPLSVHGDGEQSRCFCDVRDIVPALPLLIASENARGRAVNLGTEHPVSINELATLVVETLGSTSSIEHTPYEHAYPPGFEDLHRRRPDVALARSLIDFQPEIPLTRTIVDLAGALGHAGAKDARSQ